MSSNDYYARFAAESRMAELRREAATWRLARAAVGARSVPGHPMRSLTARIAATPRRLWCRRASRTFAPQHCGC
jgi:hypothetical protein